MVGTHHRFEEETSFLEYDIILFSNIFSIGSGWYANYWLRTNKDLKKERIKKKLEANTAASKDFFSQGFLCSASLATCCW